MGDDASKEDIDELKRKTELQMVELESAYEVMDGVLSDGAVENKSVRLMAKMDLAYAKEQWDQALQLAKDTNLTLTLPEKPAHPDASDDGWCYDI